MITELAAYLATAVIVSIVTLACLAPARLRQREVDRWLSSRENFGIEARADAQHAAWLRWEATGEDFDDYRKGLYGEYPPDSVTTDDCAVAPVATSVRGQRYQASLASM